ncbi:MAG: type VI secretion system protein [Anaeromyxobacteraceae bacterium]
MSSIGARACSRWSLPLSPFSLIGPPCYPGGAGPGSYRPARREAAISTLAEPERPAPRGWIALAAGAAAVAGFVLAGLPTLDAPGYELGELLALGLGLLAPLAAFPAARALAARSPVRAALSGTARLLAVAGALAAGAALRAALGACAAATPAAWFVPLLAVPSAALGAATAVLAWVLAGGRRGRAAALYALAVAGSLGWTLWTGWTGPAAFGHDPFLGAWPGPGVLYDEPVAVDLRMVLWRAGALALAVAAVGAAGLAAPRRRPLAALTAIALGLAGAWGAGAALRAEGLAGDRAAIQRALAGRLEGERCLLVHAGEKPRAAAAALLADCEFHAADVARALGLEHPPRITVYVYRSAAEKQLLVGAGRTDYVKPWHPEIHVVDGALPHPTLRHELVHALAAALAPGPLHVPARLRVVPSQALIEGLAVALDLPRGGYTVHELARAARDQGLLPDPVGLFSPAGFFGQGPARSYATAGSFIAFALERHGPAAIARAYAGEDLAAAAGVPWPELDRAWKASLDAVATPPGLALSARARFTQRSVFARRCAREETALLAAAGSEAAWGRTAAACALYARAGALGDEAGAWRARADVLVRAGDLEGAAAAYASARAAAGEGSPMAPGLEAAGGDLAWRRGDLAGAASRWRAALALGPDRGEARLLEAKLLAVAEPTLAEAARAYLLGEGEAGVSLARVARSPHPLAAYLLARQLAGRGEAAAAIPELERAAAGGLGGQLGDEARLLLGEARCAGGAPAAGAALLGELVRTLPAAADRERAAAGVRRCSAAAAAR